MSQFTKATLNLSRDANGNPSIAYTIVYATGDMAQGNASGQFAQQIIADFYPQAMADLNKGQSDDGDTGTGI